MSRWYLIALCGFAAGCGKSESKKQSEAAQQSALEQEPSPQPAAVQPMVESELEPGAIAWTQHSIDELGISVPTIDGVDVRSNTMNTNSYVVQSKRPIRAAFWVGSGRTVENWRSRVPQDRRDSLSAPETVEVCGTKGTKQSQSKPEGRMQVGFATAEELPPDVAGMTGAEKPVTKNAASELAKPQWKKVPATTTTVLGFERNGVPVLASFSVETERRDAFLHVERAYFDGIVCSKP